VTDQQKLQRLARRVLKLATTVYNPDTCDADCVAFEAAAKALAQAILKVKT
jgi:hypothetical protein